MNTKISTTLVKISESLKLVQAIKEPELKEAMTKVTHHLTEAMWECINATPKVTPKK